MGVVHEGGAWGWCMRVVHDDPEWEQLHGRWCDGRTAGVMLVLRF